MFDIFYSGKKPNVAVYERKVDSIEHAKQLCRTRYFWWVHYLADLSTWNFFWEPAPWQRHQRHAWPNQHQPDSGIYLVPCDWNGEQTNYHSAPKIHHGVDSEFWHIPDWIDANGIDSHWSPDPCDPPYIYEFPVEWGWDRVGGPQYRMPGATEIKYIDNFVARTCPNPTAWYQHCTVEWPESVKRWRPCPTDPPYNYVFGNQWYAAEIMPTVEYRMPGALGQKYMDLRVLLPQRHDNRWHTLHDCDWDYSWVPDPGDPPYIYVWGNQHWPAEKMPTVEYHVPGATQRKYMNWPAKLLSCNQCWQIPHYIDPHSVDQSWRPDPHDPPYIYEFATQWQPNGGARYVVPGATEVKYVDIQHRRLSDNTHWQVFTYIDKKSIDFSWHPDATEQPYIYEFATQWQPNGGARYVVPGATEVKYVDIQHRRLSDNTHWQVPVTVDTNSIDFSWHPDATEPGYIYEFATQWQPNGGAQYVVPGATEVKYVDIQHHRLSDSTHWQVPSEVDANSIDFSWHPDATEQPYIYEFATQWQPNGGARYLVPGATEIKYVDIQHRRLPDQTHWQTPALVDLASVDYSWHPDATEQPYIYEFATQWQPNGGAQYVVPGATEIKYVDIQHRRLPDSTHWQESADIDIDSVDYSWHPDATEQPYIYEFATQWQPNGGARYVVPGATEIKYMAIQHVRIQNTTHWQVPSQVDANSIDFSWHPDATEQPYIYEFATQWQPNGGARYVVPGATEIKYVAIQHVRLPNLDNWCLPEYIALESVDTSWHPDATEQPYIYEFATQWQPNGGAVYTVPGAVAKKYVDIQHRRLDNHDHWYVHKLVDSSSVDFSWHPDATEPPYIYEFATQWQPNGGAVYTVPGATEIKYLNIQHRRLPDKQPWQLLEAVAEFDYSWHPDNTEHPYNYVFGNQHWPGTEMPTAVYCVPGADQEKFVEHPVARLWACMGNWEFCEDIDQDTWDWSWVPNPKEPPYIYVFGNQWHAPELRASLMYHVEDATEFKYMDRRTRRLPQPSLFETKLPVADFDWSWEPDPTDPPMTYVFGNQWNDAVIEPTVIFNNGGTDIKYVNDICAHVAADRSHWTVLDDIEQFDFSWRPNPTDPPYIYVFGNQWHPPEQKPTLQYHVNGATKLKYMDHPRALRLKDPGRFQQLYPCEFDWSWEPDPGSPPYDYVFGNQYYTAEVMPTVIYHVPGAAERKYMDVTATLLPAPGPAWQVLHDCEWDYTWRPEPGSPAYIYVFGNQWWSAEKMPTVEYHMPGATERKFMPAPVAQLPVCHDHWFIPPRVDTSDMDFSWVPDPGEPPYIYQFATQHQKTGGPQYRMPGATEFKYVDWMRAEVTCKAVPIFEIDHLDGNAGQIPDTVRKIRYFDNYRDTLIRLAKSLVGEYEHVWVCSSICDYNKFDFSWHPETWQSTMLHVFASDEQKFGDTFYMHVPTFAERAEKKKLLEWYSVNYVPRIRVPRRPIPVFVHNNDSHVDAIQNQDFTAPLALFTVESHIDRAMTTVPLWRQELKTITPISSGATAVIVPKAAVGSIRTQLYDYPNIDKTKVCLKSQPLDIVFISNGEPNADQNFDHLSKAVANTKANLHRIDGVNGRVTAYHAAALASTTAWFFAVFAKLEVNLKFDWSWQPDRMQQAKHYIFHAKNPINGLEYGHQAMIAYNKRLVLENTGHGLDFTLDQPHEVVPILSGTAWYADSPWMAWRTAFREVIKLKASLPDVESEYRLDKWLTGGVGPGEWSNYGAEDAVEYYDLVSGNLEDLKKSYEWAWLASYAFIRRNLTPDR